ncbi:siderophore-interacting protein [Hamadaea tsunoensis]|uniref:siderophore-interacting protein n=1 Tax=Hamadaea tsunoensis TaxID=53368 RepID=UPI000422F965|nr:siderophore-interacting protein [Hamadaea tsunoensis]
MNAPFRFFTTTVREVRRLSPGFTRVTLTGPDLHRCADNGYDQRVKVILPLPGGGFTINQTPSWYADWRALDPAQRNVIRTYTLRSVRPSAAEVDIDFAVHGDTGPASAWALSACAGDELLLLAPNADFDGDPGGVEFRLPAPRTPILLAGDETAVPAIASILERLPPSSIGEAFLEVPSADDALRLDAPAGFTVTWLPRPSSFVDAVVAAALRLLPHATPDTVEPDDDEPLWEVPSAAATAPVYAWIAGESSVVRDLRRRLVGEVGLPKSAVAFMGYWRQGLAEN